MTEELKIIYIEMKFLLRMNVFNRFYLSVQNRKIYDKTIFTFFIFLSNDYHYINIDE